MTVMHLSVSFQQPCDTTRSARDEARREALTRLQHVRSVFDILLAEQVAEFAASDAPVTAGSDEPGDEDR